MVFIDLDELLDELLHVLDDLLDDLLHVLDDGNNPSFNYRMGYNASKGLTDFYHFNLYNLVLKSASF